MFTLVLGFQVGASRTLESLRQAYTRRAGHDLVRAGFHKRLNGALARLLKKLAEEAMAELGTAFGLTSGALAGFRDLLAIDSTVLRLHDLLSDGFAACRTNQTKAAAKLHVVMGVPGSPKRVKLSPERTSDITPWRRVGQWVRGYLLLFDLGYYSFHLFDRIDDNGGFFLSRLKSNANPEIVAANRKWRGRSVKLVGRKLQDVLSDLRRSILDVQVEVRFKARVYRGRQAIRTRTFRLVAVRNDETGLYHCYLTNIPPERLSAEEIRETYALSWQVELLFKAMARHGHLKQLPSRKRSVVECLVWASVLAATASQALYRAVRQRVRADRHMPPLRWAALFGRNAADILGLLLHPDPDAERDLVRHLAREAPDPNRNRRKRSLPQVPCALVA